MSVVSATLTPEPILPNGTVCGAYRAQDQIPLSESPRGGALDTSTVTAGSLTFDGLAPESDYYAFGLVDGHYRSIRFRSPPAIATSGGGGTAEPIGGQYVVTDLTIGGGGATGNVAQIQAAINACAASANGGEVILPAGYIEVNAELVIPPAQVNLLGQGAGATHLKWTGDLGLGKFALNYQDDADPTQPFDWRKRTLRGMHIEGFHNDTIFSNSHSGVRWVSELTIEDVSIEHFLYGLWLWGDHQNFFQSRVRECYYGVYLPNGMLTVGDQHFLDCDLSGNRWASIGVANQAFLIADFERVHMGNGSPYAIVGESGVANEALILQSRFSKVYAEAIGCAFINSNNRWVVDSVFRDVIISSSVSWRRGQPYVALLDLGTGVMRDVTWDWVKHFLHTATTEPPSFIKADHLERCSFDHMGMVMDKVIANDWKFLKLAQEGSTETYVRWGNGNKAVIAALGSDIPDGAALTPHIQFTGSYGTTPILRTVQDGEAIFGYACNSALLASDRSYLVQTEGEVVSFPSVGNIAQLARVTGANFGKVRQAADGEPSTGIARNTVVGGAALGVNITPLTYFDPAREVLASTASGAARNSVRSINVAEVWEAIVQVSRNADASSVHFYRVTVANFYYAPGFQITTVDLGGGGVNSPTAAFAVAGDAANSANALVLAITGTTGDAANWAGLIRWRRLF